MTENITAIKANNPPMPYFIVNRRYSLNGCLTLSASIMY